MRQRGVDLYLSGHHHAFYPGHKDGVHYVSQSCLGAGPRRLIGSAERSRRSLTLIELDGQQIRIAALQSPSFTRPIDWACLPVRIRSETAELIRADLVDGALDGSRQETPRGGKGREGFSLIRLRQPEDRAPRGPH